METLLYNKQKELYTFYNDRVRWVIVFIELRYKKFPVPLLNEIRAAQDHITRCFETGKAKDCDYVKSQIEMAQGHYMRCLLDGYKYIWYHFGAEIKRKYFFARLFGKLSDINNGEFAATMQQLFRQSKKDNMDARLCETKDKAKSIDLYEKSIGALIKLDDLYEDNESAIRWSVRKGMTQKVIYYLGWIIALALTVVRYWNTIIDFFE